MKTKKLDKKTITMKDGRYLVYYSWMKKSAKGKKVKSST